jgi:2-dehydropantoate 2-reductase
MKCAIVGAGALGSTIGCVLALNGCKDITLVEVDKDRVELIRREGIDIIMPDGSEHNVRIAISYDPAEVGICDLVQISVKGYHTDSAMQMSKPMIGPDTRILSVQNGLGNLDVIAKYVGSERVIGGVTAHSAQLLGANRVRYAGGMGYIYVGRIDGRPDDRVAEIAAFYTKYGFKTDVCAEQIDIPIWRKLVANVANNAFLAITGMTGNEALACEEAKEFMKIVAEEMALVARAKGYTFDIFDNPGEWALKTLAGVKDNKVSMLQDLEAGRRTEIDNLNYAIVKMGQELGIATPYNFALSMQIKAIEAKARMRKEKK